MTRFLASFLLLLAPLSAQVRFHPVEKDKVLHRLASAPLDNKDRQAALVQMFAEAGCKAELQPLPHSKLSNVICILPGRSQDAIIVGGHLDKVELGKGIVDDWSGASLLPTLYQSLNSLPPRHTFIFVGFADEEKGLIGSRLYVKEMSPEARAHAKDMINLECLGMNPTEVWASHSDPMLLRALAVVSEAMKMKVAPVNVERVGTTDSESFAAVKIPRTTLHSVDPKNLDVLHSFNDNMTAIHPDEYYDSYRLIAAYLTAIDSWFDNPELEKGRQTASPAGANSAAHH